MHGANFFMGSLWFFRALVGLLGAIFGLQATISTGGGGGQKTDESFEPRNSGDFPKYPRIEPQDPRVKSFAEITS
jgi:hypothetical protein